jgi:hypothetical protein
MKTINTTSATKMINRFDAQLKKILLNDLKTVKAVKAKLLSMQSTQLSVA